MSHPIRSVDPALHSVNPFESLDMFPISGDLLPSDEVFLEFHVFLIFGVVGSIKSMQCGYSLDAELNSASNELSRSEFE